MPFIKELKKLGLKDKEALVYLTCLQLGPAPAQQISRKASIVRATTYVVLEALMKRGLVTQYKEGKKTLFSAESPGQLLRLLEKTEGEIKEKKHELNLLLPELQMLVKAGEGKPSVRYFDGVEGLRAIRREMIMYSQPGDTWYNFAPIDYLSSIFGPDEDYAYYNQRVGKNIKMKTINSTRLPEQKKKILADYERDKITERRFVPSQFFNIPSGLTVFRDRIAIGSFTGKVGGVIIEGETMADMVKCLFELAWLGAERLDEEL